MPLVLVRIEDIASSRVRLTLSGLLSSRPRTLTELSEATGISVQAVLKHLGKLDDLGILTERNMPKGKYLRPRKLYFIKSRKVADYSQDDVLVATLGGANAPRAATERFGEKRSAYEELDELAQDIIMLKRRVRDLSRKTIKIVDEVVDTESRITSLLGSLDLTDEERQIAYLIFTEDEPERVRAILRDHYGCLDPGAAVAAVFRKVGGERT